MEAVTGVNRCFHPYVLAECLKTGIKVTKPRKLGTHQLIQKNLIEKRTIPLISYIMETAL